MSVIIGKSYTFLPFGHASLHDANGVNVGALNGQTVRIIEPLDPTKYDAAEVGPMYVVETSDGVRFEVFGDELQETDE